MKFNFTPEQYEELAEMFDKVAGQRDIGDEAYIALTACCAELWGRHNEHLDARIDEAKRNVLRHTESD